MDDGHALTIPPLSPMAVVAARGRCFLGGCLVESWPSQSIYYMVQIELVMIIMPSNVHVIILLFIYMHSLGMVRLADP